jgi:hypothetical protein
LLDGSPIGLLDRDRPYFGFGQIDDNASWFCHQKIAGGDAIWYGDF